MYPLVTVIIPVFNRASTIRRAIDSVLEQSYKDLELIVVDDCSSDNTVQIVNSYQDRRVSLICLPQNCGANTARNTGLRVAKGEYIAFQDSDDEWLKDKLEIQIDYMNKSRSKACYCPYTLFTEQEKFIIPAYADQKEIYEEKIMDTLRKESVISTQTLVIHKSIIEKVGMFDETMKRLQDYEFVIRICQKYKIAYVNQPLVNVYRMKECISNASEALADALGRILTKHTSFIDFESIIHTYLYNCEWYDSAGVNWEWIDTVCRNLGDADKTEKVEQCNKVKEYMMGWYHYFTKNIVGNEFVIYGAGAYGKKVYKILKELGAVPKNFWVTYNQQEEEIDGIPILKIPDRINRQIPVVVSVSRKKQRELVDNLISRGVENYYIYPFG
jgi:glycosyltransferase involved in cell wall biosynthesis